MKTGKLTQFSNLLLIVSVLFTSGALAGLSASVDRTTLSEVDIFTLTLESDDPSNNAELDLKSLSDDFQILETKQSSQQSISFINGQGSMKSTTEWHITLRPHRQGRLTIPSISLGADHSKPITINVVSQTQSAKRRNNHLLFFETEVDAQEVYVQAQIVYSVKFYFAESLKGDFSSPQIDDAIVEVLNKEKRYQSTVNGQGYYVVEKRYALFPQKSGTLTIPRETFSGYRGGNSFSLFGSRERVGAVSEQISVKVKPKPASFPSAQWLPATSLSLAESWSTDPWELQVGEPVNRTITLSATAIPARMLPAIDDINESSLKIYRDPADTSNTLGDNGVSSIRAEVMSLVPTQPGSLTLPEIRITWWNTREDKLEEAIIPAVTYSVRPAAQVAIVPSGNNLPAEDIAGSAPANASSPEAVASPTSSVWLYLLLSLSLALLVICIVMVRQLRFTKRELTALKYERSSGHPSTNNQQLSEDALYRKFVQACHENNPQQIQQRLLAWAQHQMPDIETLSQFTSRQNIAELTHQLENIDQQLYGNSSPQSFTSADILDVIARIRHQQINQKKKQDDLLVQLNPV